MNHKNHTFFTRALNTATEAINAASGLFQELTLPEGETTVRFKLSDYGEFPVTDVRGQDIIQVIDKGVGETLALNFGSLRGKFATFFRGIPMFEGHADDAEWLKKNPGHKASAVARIKSIDPEDDAIWATAAINSAGVDLLGGDAPKYTGHSPNWRLSQIPGKPGYYKPILLWSVALTNTPNIMTNTIALNSLQGVGDPDPSPNAAASADGESENQEQNNEMKLTPDALKALGFAPDAEPTTEEISAAIVKMFSDKATAEADKVTAVGETTAANSRATRLETELKLVRGTAVDTVLTDAINSGRIAEADKDKWTQALNTDFPGESAKLAKLMPVLNTENKVAGKTDKERGQLSATTTDALNTAVRGIAKENGLDLTKTADYDKAWAMLRTAKPELFSK
jgi:hypothetical protein